MDYTYKTKRTYEDTLSHHGIKGMKWGVRRYQNKDGSLTDAGRKRHYQITKRYAELDERHRGTKTHERAERKFKRTFEKYVGECKGAVDRYWEAMIRLHDYERPFIDEWGRLNDEYIRKHSSDTKRIIENEDDIPIEDRRRLKRQAAKNVSYDENEAKRLSDEYEKARYDAEQTSKKIADQILGEYGDIPIANIGYANEETAKDIVSDLLIQETWVPHRLELISREQ